MPKYLTTALLLAGVAFIVSLVYQPLHIPTLSQSSAAPAATSSVQAEIPVEEATMTSEEMQRPTVQISGQAVRVTISATEASREKGLSGRAGLGLNEGMLFVFSESGIYSFWMKDMLFSIDIVWISEGGSIVHMTENVTPESYPSAFASSVPARYVLELPAGWVSEHGVKLGDAVGL